mmetsp:Transcript_23664/g.35732  ORF Transcript_23664/g.35732 Transcript_23664/m.35732 type:complete len:135 (-) Transcript_23664:612-1016(-)
MINQDRHISKHRCAGDVGTTGVGGVMQALQIEAGVSFWRAAGFVSMQSMSTIHIHTCSGRPGRPRQAPCLIDLLAEASRLYNLSTTNKEAATGQRKFSRKKTRPRSRRSGSFTEQPNHQAYMARFVDTTEVSRV